MNLSRYAAVLVLLMSASLPALAAAQTTATSTYVRGHYYDGYSESTTTHIGGYYGQQLPSAAQQQIAVLAAMSTGQVTMPVLFGVGVKDISPNFGDPRPNGRTHEGEDIMADEGTPIVSPTLAVVLKVETGVSEGNAVYTANPGGETFVYMHLEYFGEGVVAGEVLQPGALIGYVGNTGDAAGGPSHLHLEIHNAAGTPTDPFPRLTLELTLQQKITDLAPILAVESAASSTQLATLLVTNFRSTFIDALAANIALPQLIINALATVPQAPVVVSAPATLPAGDLELGSSGAAVIALQTYIIQAASGAAAARLAIAGATGAFGPLTQAALIEYQAAVGISPASGYYGPLTRAYITAHPNAAQTSVSGGSTTGSSAITRDLTQGMRGEDVRTLQKLLNANGYTVATSGAGSAGQESTYFGPATLAAVIAYQKAHSIVPAVGYVGPITRASLATL